MWHPSPHQPPCPSRRSKSQKAAMGSIPCAKCLSPIVRGLVRFPKLHPSAKAINWIRDKEWKTLIDECCVKRSDMLNCRKKSNSHVLLMAKIKGRTHIQKVFHSINKSEYFSPIMCPNDLITLHKVEFFFCFRFFNYYRYYTIAHVTAEMAQFHGMINTWDNSALQKSHLNILKMLIEMRALFSIK